MCSTAQLCASDDMELPNITSCFRPLLSHTDESFPPAGDIAPKTRNGRLVASFAAILGIFVIALPVTVVGGNFAREYTAYLNACKRAKREEDAREEAKRGTISPPGVGQAHGEKVTWAHDANDGGKSVPRPRARGMRVYRVHFPPAVVVVSSCVSLISLPHSPYPLVPYIHYCVCEREKNGSHSTCW